MSADTYGGNPPVGSGGLGELHNTPLHVSAVGILIPLAVIIGLKVLGFRFVVGANVGGGLG